MRARTLISIAASAGVLAGFSGCATSSRTPQPGKTEQAEALSHYSLALLANNAGDTATALNHFDTALKNNPHEPRIYAAAITVALRTQQIEKAEQLAADYVKKFPKDEAVQLMSGQVHLALKQPQKAEASFLAAAKKFPQSHNCALALVQFYIAEKNKDAAINALVTATAAQPENSELMQLLGILYIDSARDSSAGTGGQENIRKGIEQFRRVIKLNPANEPARRQLGLALLAAGDADEGIDIFRQLYLQSPDNVENARQYMEMVLMARRTADALALYPQLAGNTGSSPDAWLQLIEERTPAEERDLLFQHLENIVGGADAEAFFHSRLASLHINKGDTAGAGKILTDALTRYPDDSRLLIILGQLRNIEKRFDESYAALEKVRTAEDKENWVNNPFFIYHFVLAAQLTGHTDAAAERLAASFNSHPAVLDQYIQLLISENRPVGVEDAVRLIETALEKNSEAPAPLRYLIHLYSELKRYDNAIDATQRYETAIKNTGDETPLNAGFYFQSGAMKERAGQIENAEAAFRKAIELGDADIAASAKNYIAYMRAERGENLEEGLKLIQEALTHRPDDAAFIDTLGWIYYMSGSYEKALEALLRALQIENTDATIWEHIGDTYFKLGNMPAAVEHWQKAVELDPQGVSEEEKSE